jgi:hypothetical protein
MDAIGGRLGADSVGLGVSRSIVDQEQLLARGELASHALQRGLEEAAFAETGDNDG